MYTQPCHLDHYHFTYTHKITSRHPHHPSLSPSLLPISMITAWENHCEYWNMVLHQMVEQSLLPWTSHDEWGHRMWGILSWLYGESIENSVQVHSNISFSRLYLLTRPSIKWPPLYTHPYHTLYNPQLISHIYSLFTPITHHNSPENAIKAKISATKLKQVSSSIWTVDWCLVEWVICGTCLKRCDPFMEDKYGMISRK